MTETTAQAIRHIIALQPVFLPDLSALEELIETAGGAAVLDGEPGEAFAVEVVVGRERGVDEAGGGFAVDETGAEGCFEAELKWGEAVEEAVLPFLFAGGIGWGIGKL